MVDLRKNLILLIFVLTGVLISLLVLNFQKIDRSKPPHSTMSSGGKQKAQVLINDSTSKNFPVKLSKAGVNFFDLKSGTSKVIFYEATDSTVYEVGFDAKNKKELVRIPNLSEVVFNPRENDLIATSDKNRKIYFDLANSRRVKLDERIKNVSFSPDGKRIAYYFYDDRLKEGSISIANPNGSDFITIFRTRIGDARLLWPENDKIIIHKAADSEGSIIFSIRPDGNELKKLSDQELVSYLNQEIKEAKIIKELGIEAIDVKVSPLKDYLIFINTKDGKLYSLRYLEMVSKPSFCCNP